MFFRIVKNNLINSNKKMKSLIFTRNEHNIWKKSITRKCSQIKKKTNKSLKNSLHSVSINIIVKSTRSSLCSKSKTNRSIFSFAD